MATHLANAGVLSSDRSRQRVAPAPAVVRAELAMGDLLGADDGLVQTNAIYRCLDKPLEHRRRCSIICASAGESSLPDDDNDKRRCGYSRDSAQTAQVVIALIVTPEGFPLAY